PSVLLTSLDRAAGYPGDPRSHATIVIGQTGPKPHWHLAAQLWNYDTGERVLSTPCIVDGWVYIGGSCGRFFAFR
ncbi:MAG: PQQ-binding-like beta-propeller repeat protein, partial [Deltaproteobacteria bacterium]|nr:PQQ-binding-like beta-propeller repeat protein [Deltaproteobacteria bacterium]